MHFLGLWKSDLVCREAVSQEGLKSDWNVWCSVDKAFCCLFLSLVYWRSLLLHSSLQSGETPICQHGCANSSGHLHSLHLFIGGAYSGHGGEGKSKPYYLLRHTAYALCFHLPGTLAGTDCQGWTCHHYWYLWLCTMLKFRTWIVFISHFEMILFACFFLSEQDIRGFVQTDVSTSYWGHSGHSQQRHVYSQVLLVLYTCFVYKNLSYL